MEEEYGSLSWACYFQEEGIEELKHSLMYNTSELENTIVSAHEELARKEDEMMHLQNLLIKAIQERDDAQAKCHILSVENFNLQQLLQTSSLTSTIEDIEAPKTEDSPSSNCDENFTTSPPPLAQLQPSLAPPPEIVDGPHKLVITKTLPENGKFLQAVMEAGPLLQTLLLAGPLPQWQHPPPQLNSVEIPPVTILSQPPKPGALLMQQKDSSTSGCLFSKKRSLAQCEDFDFFPSAKNQKVVQQYSLTSM
ncbi:uncharacterized protein LOC141697720 [Apium graveolens]|uniref:uncharacterized protein LOC141697720 n=1 Tax=Apium graveolens TaxID=4045 RepID=UPI003D790575